MIEQSRGGSLSIRHAGKIYDPAGSHVVALQDVWFDMKPGEFCVVVGPSSYGKTTLLNSIAGFDQLTSGEILLDGDVISSPGEQLQPSSAWLCFKMVRFSRGRPFFGM